MELSIHGNAFHKIWQVMRLTAFLLFAVALNVSAKTHAQQVTLASKGMRLEKVFSQLKQQTGYSFLCDYSLLENTPPVKANIQNASLKQALDSCLSGLPLTYEIRDKEKMVFIKAKQPEPNQVFQGAPPPPNEIHGRVVDSTGAPLANASVLIKGTKRGTQTDAQGKSSFNYTESNIVLVVSFTGYETKEYTPGGDNNVLIVLHGNANVLDEVVSKGYYNTARRLSTGSISVVKGEDIQKQPVSNPITALEGRVPGLYIAQASGMPGAAYSIKLRGQNSIASGNNPLYIVDGVPFTANTLTNPFIGVSAVGRLPVPPDQNAVSSGTIGISPFNSLNPSDIESIEVLKDADATAIYGSRGANGVILITTKKGKAGVTKFDANVYSGAGEITRQLHLLNTQQYLALRHEAFQNDGTQPDPTYDFDITGTWDTTRYADWQKELIGGTAQFTNAQLNLTGGNSNTQFVLGGGYSRQTTVFPGDYLDEKISTHISVNHVSTNQKFKASFAAQYVYNNNVLPNTDFTGQITLAPDAPAVYDANGNLNWADGSFDSNPMYWLLTKTVSKTSNLLGNLNVRYEILPGLQIGSSFGFSHIQLNQSR